MLNVSIGGQEYDFVILNLVCDPDLLSESNAGYFNNIEYGNAIAWANAVLNYYSDSQHYRKAIVITHGYIDDTGAITDDSEVAGIEINADIVNGNSNVIAVLCGHESGSYHDSSTGVNGNTVWNLLSDYQDLDNGGRGYFRLYKVYPQSDEVEVDTVSPYNPDPSANLLVNYVGTSTGIDYSDSYSPFFLSVNISGTEQAAPFISSVSTISPSQIQTITISGIGFGAQAAYNGDSAYLRVTDLTGGWEAGYGSDTVTTNVTSWTDHQIVISGLTGKYGVLGCTLNPGDEVQVDVWNVPSLGGPASYTTSVVSTPSIWVDAGYTSATPGWGVDYFAKIQDGINAVSGSGSTVHVAAGTYREEGIVLKDGVVVLGAGQGSTIIRGMADGSPVVIANNVGSSTKLSGFTITHGDAGGVGGGMRIGGSSLTIANCTFDGNLASAGAGMYMDASSPTIINCVFQNNIASSVNYGGGAIYIADGSSPTIVNCIFRNNSAASASVTGGGAICNDYSSPTITNCVFVNNTAKSGLGGAIYNTRYAGPTITNCILWDDSPDEIDIEGTSSHMPVVSYSDVAGALYAGTGNINTAPMFKDAANGVLMQHRVPCAILPTERAQDAK